MKDLFDMTAGTSTGSILAAGLSYPNNTIKQEGLPGYFAPDLIKIYAEMGDQIFKKSELDDYSAFLWCLIILIPIAIAGHYTGSYFYDSQEIEDSFTDTRQHVSNMKRKQKGKQIKFTEFKLQDKIPKKETESSIL